MLGPDDPLFDLEALAALSSPLPLLVVRCADAREHTATAEALAAAVGPTPQAERWDGHDGRSEVRVRLPGLDMGTWLSLSRRLSRLVGWFALVPGDLPPFEDAVAEGVVAEEHRRPGALFVRRWTTLDGTVLRRWDVARHPATREVLQPLRRELGQALAPLGLDDGSIRVLVRRWDGRTGLELVFPSATGPDARAAILERLSAVVTARAGHTELRLAPDLTAHETTAGLQLHTWFVRRHLTPLPVGHAGDAHGRPPHAGSWAPGATAVSVVAPSRHDAFLAAVQQAHPDLHGAAPRWMHRRSSWRFGAAWSAHAPFEPALRGLLCLPSLPAALDDGTGAVVVHPHRGRRRWFVRHHHTWHDADLLPVVQARPADAIDRRWSAWIVAALSEVDVDPDPDVGDAWLQPVSHGDGAGVELRLSAASAGSEARYRRVLDALGALHDEVGPYAPVAFRSRRLAVQLWRQDASPPDAWDAVTTPAQPPHHALPRPPEPPGPA